MRKLTSILVIVVVSHLCVNAQDLILTKTSDIIKAKVTEISSTEIKYKKFDNENGPTYSILKSEIKSITYQNGEKEEFSTINKNGNNCEIELPNCGITVACLDFPTEITWAEANANAPDGWRLPSIKELQCMCQYQGRIRLNEKDEYWSSTMKGDKAYSVTMDDCEDELNKKGKTRAVRYVK